MAGNAVIGALRVNLGLDSAEFQNGAKKAQSTLAGLGAAIKGFAAGAVAGLSLGAVTAALKSSINHMDELGKAAQKIGMPVDELSKLEYAAKLADVSLEQLEVSIGRFSKSLAEIAGGGSNDAGAALKAMGISAVDANGKLRPTSDILADVAAKFATYKDGAEKTALSMAMLGKSGADLIPLLNGGRDAIKSSGDELLKFGGVVTPEAAAQAEKFNDNLTRVKEAGLGLATIVASNLSPAMADISESFVDWVKNGDIAKQIWDGLNWVIQQGLGFLYESVAIWKTLAAYVNATGAAFDALTSGDLTGASNAFARAGEEASAAWADAEKKFQSLKASLDAGTGAPGKGSLPGTLGDILAGKAGAAKTDAPVIQTIAKIKPAADAGAKALDNLKAAGQRVWEDTRTPLESYQLEIRNLNDLLAQGMIDHDTYARAVKQLQDQFGETGKAAEDLGLEMAQSLGQTMQSWIDDAIQGTFDLKDALRGLLSQLTNLAMNSAFANLFSGGGVAPSQSGGILGNLFGNLFGFASGGTILPGGTGGIDSQLVAFRKSPNERVDITKPGQTLGSRGDVNVTVINQSRAQVETSQDANGNPQLLIRDAVRGEISRAMKPILAAQYGITPKSQRR